jgi:hypothetical protein
LCLKANKRKLYHLGIRQNVNQSSLSRANERRDWRIFEDFGKHLICKVRCLYANHPLPDVELQNEIFVLDSTSISVSIKLLKWAFGKRSKGAVKVHTLMDLRGSIPTFIHITDEKTHDINTLDLIDIVPNAI